MVHCLAWISSTRYRRPACGARLPGRSTARRHRVLASGSDGAMHGGAMDGGSMAAAGYSLPRLHALVLCRAESAPHGLTRGVAAGSFRCTTRSVSDTSSDTASDTLSHGGYMRASCRLRSAWEVDWDDWRAHHRGHGRALAEVHTVCAYALGPRAGRSAGFADSMGVGAALLAVRTVVSGVCLPGLLFVYWRSVLRTVCLVDALQLCLYDRHPARISAYSILRNSGAHIYVHQRYVS